MVRTAVLDDSTATIPARSNDQHGFRVYQLTTIGTSDAIIRTLVPVPISAPPHIVKPSSLRFVSVKSLYMQHHRPSLLAIWSPLSLHIFIWVQRLSKGKRRQHPTPSATIFFALLIWRESTFSTPRENQLLSPTLLVVQIILLTLLSC